MPLVLPALDAQLLNGALLDDDRLHAALPPISPVSPPRAETGLYGGAVPPDGYTHASAARSAPRRHDPVCELRTRLLQSGRRRRSAPPASPALCSRGAGKNRCIPW